MTSDGHLNALVDTLFTVEGGDGSLEGVRKCE